VVGVGKVVQDKNCEPALWSIHVALPDGS